MTSPQCARFKLAPDVQHRRFHEETVVLDLGRGEYFALDEVGSSVWEGLTAGKSMEEVVASLAAVYDADSARIAADVRALVDELVRRGLIVPVAAGPAGA
jgi:hypothetical protein